MSRHLPHRCWAEIDLDALRHNARACRAAAPAGCAVVAIVKAGAYGHGMNHVAPALRSEVDAFAVANLAEATELAAVPGCHDRRILLLSPLLPDERAPAIAAGFEIPVSTRSELDAYLRVAEATGKVAHLHAVADTGMGRMGAASDDFPDLVAAIRQVETGSGGKTLRLRGIATHLPSADEETDFTRGQVRDFRALLDRLRLPDGVDIHLANSAGVFAYPGEIDFATAIRPGLALYGVSPLPDFQAALRPALTWKTRLTLVRDVPAGTTISYGRTYTAPRPLRIATLAVGYADGYPRQLSGRGADVLIRGRRCPVLGRVTMDQVVVDVSDLPDSPIPGDEAVLLGRQGETEEIPAAEFAEKAGTIPWEILTGIGPRVVRAAV